VTANHQRLASLRTTAVAAAHTTIEPSQIRIVGTAIVGRVMPGLGTARRIAANLLSQNTGASPTPRLTFATQTLRVSARA
jgi:hypothetical protein